MSSCAASPAALVRAKTTTTPSPAVNHNLTEDDIRSLADLAPNLLGAWRCHIRRDEFGDIEAVFARSGLRRGANRFVIKRKGSEISLIATQWPFHAEKLGTYTGIASLARYLGNAIGYRR